MRVRTSASLRLARVGAISATAILFCATDNLSRGVCAACFATAASGRHCPGLSGSVRDWGRLAATGGNWPRLARLTQATPQSALSTRVTRTVFHYRKIFSSPSHRDGAAQRRAT